MEGLFRLLLDSINYLWPFEVIHQWERGCYYVCGKFWKEMGPGLKFRPPFFTNLIILDVVPSTVHCTVETITTRDGGTLTYGPQFEIECINLTLAANRVTDHEDKARRDAWGILADVLAELPDGRLEPEKRRRMVMTCLKAINEKLTTYGMQCNDLTFTTFVRNMRTYRLFTGV